MSLHPHEMQIPAEAHAPPVSTGADAFRALMGGGIAPSDTNASLAVEAAHKVAALLLEAGDRASIASGNTRDTYREPLADAVSWLRAAAINCEQGETVVHYSKGNTESIGLGSINGRVSWSDALDIAIAGAGEPSTPLSSMWLSVVSSHIRQMADNLDTSRRTVISYAEQFVVASGSNTARAS